MALIVPSLCYETFALVVLEAFRDRTPALVRNLGSLSEVLLASGGGAAYDSDDELSSWLDRLVTDGSLRNELGLKGHSAYLREWTVDAHLERYFSLIHELEALRGDREAT